MNQQYDKSKKIIYRIIKNSHNSNTYEWLQKRFPIHLTHFKYWSSSKSFIWIPRWGYTKNQLMRANQKAEEILNNLRWE